MLIDQKCCSNELTMALNIKTYSVIETTNTHIVDFVGETLVES